MSSLRMGEGRALLYFLLTQNKSALYPSNDLKLLTIKEGHGKIFGSYIWVWQVSVLAVLNETLT